MTHKSDGMSKASIARKQERQRKMKKVTVKDNTLAAMDALAYTEFRVRIGLMAVHEFKIWAHSEEDAVEKVKGGAGTLSSKSQPEVVSVQVGLPGGAITEEQAKQQARVIENAQAQKDPTVTSMAEFNKLRTKF